MFLPLLDASKIQNGKKMIGMVVEVWTSDDQRFLYEITEVRRHQHDLDDAARPTTEQLWLQTSEGPHGTRGQDPGRRRAAVRRRPPTTPTATRSRTRSQCG